MGFHEVKLFYEKREQCSMSISHILRKRTWWWWSSPKTCPVMTEFYPKDLYVCSSFWFQLLKFLYGILRWKIIRRMTKMIITIVSKMIVRRLHFFIPKRQREKERIKDELCVWIMDRLAWAPLTRISLSLPVSDALVVQSYFISLDFLLFSEDPQQTPPLNVKHF